MHKIAILLILVGMLLRVAEYASNPSFSSDEALTALRLESISLKEAFFLNGTLPANRQSYPIGFLAALQVSRNVLGSSEYSLRLFIVLTGIFSIFLFYKVARLFLDEKWSVLALAFFCLSRDIISMSVNLKPVSFDILASLLFIGMIFPLAQSGLSWKQVVLTAFSAAALVFFSIPTIALMLSISVCFLILFLTKKDFQRAVKFMLVFFAVGATTALYYWISMRHMRNDASLLSFWSSSFLPLEQGFFSILQWFVVVFKRVFAKFLQYPAGLAAFLFGAGVIALWTKHRDYLIFLAVPILVMIAASAFKLYPFDGRTIFSLFPIILIVLVFGISCLAGSVASKRAITGLILVLMLFMPVLSSAQQFLEHWGPEEIKPVLHYIKYQQEDGDVILAYQGSSYAYRYYQPRINVSGPSEMINRENADRAFTQASRKSRNQRVWIVFSHVKFDHRLNDRLYILERARGYGRLMDSIELKVRPMSVSSTLENNITSSAYLFEMGPLGN